jgi:hypothetical protein
LAPAFGGVVVSLAGFEYLFVIVAILILVSNVPLLRTPERFEPKSFAYGGAMRRLVDPGRRRQLFGFMGFGEELVALVLWPIFIALLVPNLAVFGALISLSMLATVLVTLYVGRIADGGNRIALLRTGVVYSTASWLVRPFVIGGLGVFLVDAFYRVAKNTVAVPMMAMAYDDGGDNGVMESIIFFEMALSLGKIIAAAAAIAVLRLAPNQWPAIFALAAAFSAMYALLRERPKAT